MSDGNAAPITDGSLTFRSDGEGGVVQSSSHGELSFDPSTWRVWRKTALTRAVFIQGPFTVETSEGPLKCQQGYLAVDARGYPYPIAEDEFRKIYEPVLDGGTPQLHPATQGILRFFEYEHLPEHLQAISKGFHALAHELVSRGLEGAELTVGLRKLLEAKDCAVRAALPPAKPPIVADPERGIR